MDARVFLLDANIIYSNLLRDLFVTLGTLGLPIRWSRQLADEFVTAQARRMPGSEPQTRRILRLMEAALPDWEARAAPSRIASLSLPDPDDRHVVAAAISAGATIVTRNIRDFPPAALEAHGVAAVTPDMVLSTLLKDEPGLVLDAVRQCLARKLRTVVSEEAWLERLAIAGCPDAAKEIARLLAVD